MVVMSGWIAADTLDQDLSASGTEESKSLFVKAA
jgi:hypothetical protein